MKTFTILSARNLTSAIANMCTIDFENVISDALGAEILAPSGPHDAPDIKADVVFIVALDFKCLSNAIECAKISSNTQIVAYVFGAYLHAVKPGRNPVKSYLRRHFYRSLARVDKLFLGFDDWTSEIGEILKVDTQYLPMAADVLLTQGQPISKRFPRPVPVFSFGRQDVRLVEALADTFNNRNSSELFLNFSFLDHATANDAVRYRAMFRNVLRKSKLTLAFDQRVAPSKGGGHCSYVGPRWFECLAAGTVVVGKAPESADVPVLLDWEDAFIDLPSDVSASVDFVRSLLEDESRIQRAIAANLQNMYARHDWRHRLRDIFVECSLDVPVRLSEQLRQLERSSNNSDNQVIELTDLRQPSF